jgi:hypothetical protein
MTTPSGPRLRASDQEREQIATILRAAMTEGRLNLTDGEERMAAAYAATYRDELGPLTADLPDGGRAALARTPEARAEVRRFVRRRVTFVAVLAAVVGALWIASGADFFPVVPIILLLVFLHSRARWRYYARWHRRDDWYGGWRGYRGDEARRHYGG